MLLAKHDYYTDAQYAECVISIRMLLAKHDQESYNRASAMGIISIRMLLAKHDATDYINGVTPEVYFNPHASCEA